MKGGEGRRDGGMERKGTKERQSGRPAGGGGGGGEGGGEAQGGGKEGTKVRQSGREGRREKIGEDRRGEARQGGGREEIRRWRDSRVEERQGTREEGWLKVRGRYRHNQSGMRGGAGAGVLIISRVT